MNRPIRSILIGLAVTAVAVAGIALPSYLRSRTDVDVSKTVVPRATVQAAGLECSSGRATPDGVIRSLADCEVAADNASADKASAERTSTVQSSHQSDAGHSAVGTQTAPSADDDSSIVADSEQNTARSKDPVAVSQADAVVKRLEDRLGLDDKVTSLRPTAVRKSAGAAHVWYEQRYKGIRVHGALVGVHLDKKSGKVMLFENGATSGISLASTTPKLDMKQAQSKAAAQAGSAKQRKADSGELVVLPAAGNGGTLAWRFDVNSRKPYGHWEVFIDDASGQPLEKNDLLLGVGEEWYEYSVPFNVTLPVVQDTEINEDSTSANGIDTRIDVGGAPAATSRGLQRFDLRPLYAAMSGDSLFVATTPDVSAVQSATLYEYVSSDSAADRTINVHRVTESWDEAYATWLNRTSGGVTWDPGAAFDPTVIAARELLHDTKGWSAWNVKSLVNTWLSGVENRGLLLKDSAEGTAGANKYSIHSQDGPDGNPAYIDVRYLVPASLSLGRVFTPNPVVSSGFGAMADNNDADSATLNNQRDISTVKGLRGCIELSTGKTSLYGVYANTYDGASGAVCQEGSLLTPTSRAKERVMKQDEFGHLLPPSGDPIQCPTGPCYGYPRSDGRFEEVNAYFHLNSSRERLATLGFSDIVSGGDYLRAYQMQAEVNSLDPDTTLNAFFDPAYTSKQPVGVIKFGDEGVDLAEDADVVNHEYGHAILASQMPFATTCSEAPNCIEGFPVDVPYPLSGEEGRALHEGFADYWAYSMHTPWAAGPYGHECIGAWAAKSFGTDPCLREIDDDYKYPGNIVHEEHDDGRIWSRALYDLNRSVGRTVADKVIVESHYYYNPRQTFAEAALALVLADRSLYPNGSGIGVHESRILQVLANRGIYPTPSAFSAVNSMTSLPSGGAGESVNLAWWNGGSSTPNVQIQFTSNSRRIGTFTEGFEDGRIAPYEWRNVALTDSDGHDGDLVLAGPTPIDWDLRDPAWQPTAKWSSEGRFSARSGDVGNSRTTLLHASAYLTNPGSIAFDYRVSSEKRTSTKRGDGLFFSACGPGGCIKRGNYTGTKEGTVSIPTLAKGWWIFEWKYMKDGSDPSSAKLGADAAYIDDVRIGGVVSPEWEDIGALQSPGTEALTWSGPSEVGTYLFRARTLAGSTLSPWSYSNEYEVD